MLKLQGKEEHKPAEATGQCAGSGRGSVAEKYIVESGGSCWKRKSFLPKGVAPVRSMVAPMDDYTLMSVQVVYI